MAAPKTKRRTVKTSSNKMYTVLITCPSFGQGIDDIDLTEGFRTPARVVEVLEMSVEDTDIAIAKLGADGGLGQVFDPGGKSTVDATTDDGIDTSNGGEEEEVTGLGDIFPDATNTDDDDGGDMDFMAALGKLDEEDDLTELEDLANDGLPEL